MKLAEYIPLLAKRLYLPGFRKVSLYDIILLFIQNLRNGLLTTRAYALAFRFFMALFPALIFLFNLIPYLPIEGIREQVLSLLREFLPPTLDALYLTIEDLLTQQRSGLLSFGFILTLYLALNGVQAMIGAFQNSFNIEKKMPPLKLLTKSLVLLFILVFLFIITGTLLIAGDFLNQFIQSFHLLEKNIVNLLFNLVRWAIIIFCYITGISAIYHFGHTEKMRWRIFSPGSVFASLASIAASTAFAYYVSNFANYNKIYGSLGFIIILMMWMYLNSLILLIGFEINTTLYKARKLN